MGKAKNPFDLLQRQLLKHRAAIANHKPIGHDCGGLDEIESLELRLHKILDIVENPNRNAGNMIFFVMYDIASNKVRRAVVKYLQRKGCHRVQRSIFLADVPGNVCQEIQNDLQAIQEMYENDDSIFVVPLSVDYIRTMKVIGHDINFDLILKTKSTMFF